MWFTNSFLSASVNFKQLNNIFWKESRLVCVCVCVVPGIISCWPLISPLGDKLRCAIPHITPNYRHWQQAHWDRTGGLTDSLDPDQDYIYHGRQRQAVTSDWSFCGINSTGRMSQVMMMIKSINIMMCIFLHGLHIRNLISSCFTSARWNKEEKTSPDEGGGPERSSQ